MPNDAKTEVLSLSAPVVMAFPNLIEPKAFTKNGKAQGDPKYGATFVFGKDHPDLADIKAAIVRTAKAKWPGVDLKTIAIPLLAGEKEIESAKRAAQARSKNYEGQNDFMASTLCMKSRSKYRPALSFIDGSRIVDITDDAAVIANKEKFFFGAEVLAQFTFVAYEGDARNPSGVTAYLNMVLATGKGTRLRATNRSASSVFSGYVGGHSAEDPLGDQTDELIL